jgi:hypothetical protein
MTCPEQAKAHRLTLLSTSRSESMQTSEGALLLPPTGPADDFAAITISEKPLT